VSSRGDCYRVGGAGICAKDAKGNPEQFQSFVERLAGSCQVGFRKKKDGGFGCLFAAFARGWRIAFPVRQDERISIAIGIDIDPVQVVLVRFDFRIDFLERRLDIGCPCGFAEDPRTAREERDSCNNDTITIFRFVTVPALDQVGNPVARSTIRFLRNCASLRDSSLRAVC
jgi:hypothetical protein